MIKYLFLLVLLEISSSLPFKDKIPSKEELIAKGWKPKKDKPDEIVQVHVIPHTHDDVGWKKTVDSYFTGTKTNVARA